MTNCDYCLLFKIKQEVLYYIQSLKGSRKCQMKNLPYKHKYIDYLVI